MPKPSNLKPSMNLVVRNAVQDNSSSNTLEIQLLDLIYDTFDWDTWTYHDMVKDVVAAIDSRKPTHIKLLIDSEGGDCSIGLALYNYLIGYRKRMNATIEVEILAMCGSIATVIACSATPGMLLIPKNAFWVIHRAWGFGMGNSEDLRAAADVIDLYTMNIVDVYVDRTGMTAEQINGMIEKGDKWITGTEAVAMKFCDGHPAADTTFSIAARVQAGLNKNYRNVPDALRVQTPEQPAAAPDQPANDVTETGEGQPAGDSITNKKGAIMNLKEVAAKFRASLGKKPVNNKAENLAEEVANQMGEPLTEMMDGIQTEVKNDLDALEQRFNAKLTAYEDRIKALETANANLQKENEDLTTEVADLKGSESNAGAAAAADAGKDKPKVWGRATYVAGTEPKKKAS